MNRSSISAKLTATIFIIIIFIFGIGTLMKCDKITLLKDKSIEENITQIETTVQDNFKSYNNWININGLFQRIMGMTVIQDAGNTNVYKLDNKQIIYNLEKIDVDNYFNSIKNLKRVADKNEIDFMYVQLPFKVQSQDNMPVGVETYGNYNADELVKMIKYEKIPCIDLREIIDDKDVDYSDLFFDTDQHWKPKTAFWAAKIISNRLDEDYGYKIDYGKFDLNNFYIDTKKDWFLGSLGKRTGSWYAGVDDFDIITPKFYTDYKFYSLSRDGSEEYRYGDFEETLLKKEFIEKKDYFNINTYAGYTGGDYALNTVINNNAPNDKKILLIRDSFSCAMMPYLTMGVKEITTIDLRHYKKESLIEYIDKNSDNYDMIIVAYNPSAFTEEQFTFDAVYE